MIQKSLLNLLGIALAEIRSDLRLARTWVFIAIVVISALAGFFNLNFTHWNVSGISSFFGFSRPAAAILQTGGIYILTFSIAITFLAFDIQSRDRRDRIAEILGSRPITTFELLFGRALGIVGLFYAISVLLLLLLQSVSYIGTWQDWIIQGPMEPYSLLGFIVLDLFPNFIFWAGLIILFTVLFRFRLLVAVVALGLLISQFWLVTNLPLHLFKQFSGVGAGLQISEVTPFLIDWPTFLMRVVWTAGGIGFICLAAALHPRLDGPVRMRRAIIGGGATVGAVVLGGLVTWIYLSEIDLRDHWLAVHSSNVDIPVVDVESISGTVSIEPGDRLHADLELTFSVPPKFSSGVLLFSLNPGFEVSRLELNGQKVEHAFEDGLLRVPQPVDGSDSSTGTMLITYQGYPDPLFGYLDGSIDFLGASGMDSGVLMFLGAFASLFDSDHVVLAPAIAWYPLAGVNVARDRIEIHKRDFFNVDMDVNVPKGLDLVGPSRRNASEQDNSTQYSVKPTAPVPYVALVVGEFERRNTEIDGIQFEILMTPQHSENLDVFDDIAPLIEEDIGDFIANAKKHGLSYPYDSLTLVEVSDHLRLFGGGWRMDTAFNMPGVIFIRESSFPTANFDRLLDRVENENVVIADRERLEYKYAVVRSYFQNDINGVNILEGVLRNLTIFQTEAYGHGATALSFLVSELVKDLLFDYSGFYSAFLSASQQSFQSNAQIIAGSAFGADEPTDIRMGDAIRTRVVDNSPVWEAALATPLSQLDYESEPEQSLNVLALKVSLLADTIHAYVGDDKVSELVLTLRDRHQASTYTVEDFQSLLIELDSPIQEISGDWLEGTGLPGFVTSEPVFRHLNDESSDDEIYETSISIRNDEPTPGVITVSYREQGVDDETSPRVNLKPMRIAPYTSAEFNIHSVDPLQQIRIDPMLSLNRSPIVIEIDEGTEWPEVNREPRIPVVENTDWQPDVEGQIIVDDLDPGFSTTYSEDEIQIPEFLRFFGIDTDPDLDQGLPISRGGFSGGPFNVSVSLDSWQRGSLNSAYGKYRTTTARIRRGEGDEEAKFSAQLPKSGEWELEYHVPWRTVNRSRSASSITSIEGSYDIQVEQNGVQTKVEFDASAGSAGWNSLGVFKLDQGTVTVIVSNESTGQTVWADAIKWSESNSISNPQ